MSESFPSRIRKALEEHFATAIAVAVVGALATIWSLHAEGVFRRLNVGLGAKGIVALIFVLVAATAWLFFAWHSEKRKERPFFDRLVPVPGAGYSKDPKTGEIACPSCVADNRKAYLMKVGGNFYCQACHAAVKGIET